MEAGHAKSNGTHEREVVSGIKVIETEYRIQKPIFEEVRIPKAVFIEKEVSIPVGIEKMLVGLADDLADKIVKKVLDTIDAKLNEAISKRIKEIEVPKIIQREELNIIKKDVEVTNAVITDKPVTNAILVDKSVINPILTDKHIVNPVFEDVTIERPVFQDRVVIQPKFEEVIIQRPKYVDKEVTAIHLKYVDMQGNPEPE